MTLRKFTLERADPQLALEADEPARMQIAGPKRALPQLVAVVGPQGEQGPRGFDGDGAPRRLDAPLAGTWVLPHDLGRVPTVQVYLASGEQVAADVTATTTTVTVVFANPQEGFALAF